MPFSNKIPDILHLKQEPWPFLGLSQYPSCTVRDKWLWLQSFLNLFKHYETLNPNYQVQAGSLTSTIPASSYPIEQFLLEWTGSQLKITHTSNPNQVIWASIPGENFVGGAALNLEITQARGSVRLDEQLKVAYSQQSVENIETQGKLLIISGKLQSLVAGTEETPCYQLCFQAVKPHCLAFDLQIVGAQVGQAQLRFTSSQDEHFYGFGEQFSYIDCKGVEILVVNQEGGIGRTDPLPILDRLGLRWTGATGDKVTSYAPCPQFITNIGRSMFLSQTEPCVFDLRDANTVSIRIENSQMQGYLLSGATPLELIEHYTELVGRFPALPDWVHNGAIAGLEGGTKVIKERVTKLLGYGAPISGVWLQDWVGERKTEIGTQLWWDWNIDRDYYTNWNEFVNDFLGSKGIKVGTYINSFLVPLPKSELGKRRDLYQEAKEKGYLVKQANGEVFMLEMTGFYAGLVDFTNPEACSWFKELIKNNMIGIGSQFWMADFGEYAQFNGQFYSGESGLCYHNAYVVDWAKVNRDAVIEAGQEGETWFFTRSGALQTPSFTTAMWLGDQDVNWGENDGITSALKGMLSSGFSGFSINHSDTGGYTSFQNPWFKFIGEGFARSKELLLRWLEMNAFTAILRTHEGNQPSVNAQIYTDDDTCQAFARWAKVYAALGNYRRTLMQEAATKGYPIVRHPLLHYPNDSKLYNLSALGYEFMLGQEFLISPILKPKAIEKNVYLPAGEWVHLWSGKILGNSEQGITITMPAPLGQPPVFFLKGSAVGTDLVERLKAEGIIIPKI
ncbi:MAG: alpha-glucosidase [Symploca sp. SIO1C2]|nr:alpha-glucosidase [Symploca sp. SIO1C2]